MTAVSPTVDTEAPPVRSGHRRRIVILTEDSKPALGGIAEYLHQLALATSATHEVLVVTSVSGAEPLNPGLPFQYRERRWFRAQWRFSGDHFAPLRRFNTLVWRIGRHSAVRDTLALIHAENPDSSYVLGRLSPVTHPWCRACRSLGLSYSAIGHGLELIEPLPLKASVRRRRDIRSAAHWFVNSRDTAAKLQGLGVHLDRITLLRPGVAMAEAKRNAADRMAVRTRYGIGSDRFVLTVCHLRLRKGVDLAMRAMANLGPSAQGVRYVIAGTGPEELDLQGLATDLGIADRVVFAGAVSDEEKAALMAECSLFLLPTREVSGDVEGFGIVFLEAALHGKAVVGGKNGGVPEAVADGVSGLLVDTSDVANVTAALDALLSSPDRADTMGKRGRERAMREFRWDDRGAIFAERLDSLASAPARAEPRTNPPLVRLRREAGQASNRLASSASVLAEMLARGRLATYLVAQSDPQNVKAWVDEMLAWLDRAFAAGTDGGVSAGYHVAHGWAASYPEVTGYLVPTLLHYGAIRQSPELLESARRAGSWLARTRLAGGAVCRKQWYPGNTAPSVFNTAQVVEGWCALARADVPATEEGDWLALARQSGDWLCEQQDSDGSWVRNAFNGIAHTYYARVAAPLARLAVATGVERYAESARRGLDWVLAHQTGSGWFNRAGFTEAEFPTTHTIGYVIEGLLQGASLLNELRYADAAKVAADQLLITYRMTGRLPGRFASRWRPRARWRCLTGDAQVAVAWCLLYRRTSDARYREAARAVADDIRRTVRVTSHWPEISGGVQGSSPPWGDYDPYAYPTHAVKFALDLVALLDP